MTSVTILCTDKNHPVVPVLNKWANQNKDIYAIKIIDSHVEIDSGGDILFLISCSEIITGEIRNKFRHTLVLHASDLPAGRGWSPHIWEIISGKKEITLSLLEAENSVDTGKIWNKLTISLKGTELYDEINELLFKAETQLMSWACENHEAIEPYEQKGEASYLRKRIPADSCIDINKPLIEQINLLRVSDPVRYPAFFDYKGQKYILEIKRADK